MKYLIFIVGIAFLLASCSYDENHRYIMVNNSSRDIGFSFNDESITLSPGQSIIRIVNSWDGHRSPQNITHNGHEKSIRMIRESLRFSFVDVIPLYLNVVNTLPIAIENFRAGEYIYNSGENALTIASDSNLTSAIIFTRSPSFTTATNHHIDVEWRIVGNTMYVTIR